MRHLEALARRREVVGIERLEGRLLRLPIRLLLIDLLVSLALHLVAVHARGGGVRDPGYPTGYPMSVRFDMHRALDDLAGLTTEQPHD